MRTFSETEVRSSIHKWSWNMQRRPYRHEFGVRPGDWGARVSVSDEAEIIALSLGHSIQYPDGGHWVEDHAFLTFREVKHRADVSGSVGDVLNDLYISLFEKLEIEPPIQRPHYLARFLNPDRKETRPSHDQF
ncbi:MAG TPA: hypothetical protein VHX38_33085 [Pseudonocardiaceae bacterium]|jgi:hypothetical protein|nr:hypothetical protein [Pseudonocardiaceae bacterium]